jgi:hypothetical protein
MRAGISEMFYTSASMVAAVTSILAGTAALLLDVAGLPVLAAVIIDVGAAVPTFGLHMLWMYGRGRPAMA